MGVSTVTLPPPNGGEAWTIGSAQTLRWSFSGFTGTVHIQLSRDGGSTWTTVISGTVNDGLQNWVVPGPATTQARIRVRSVLDSGAYDASNGNFTIR